MFDLPLFPDIAGQSEAGLKGRLARPPSRGGHFACFDDVLKSQHLPEELGHVAAHFRRKNFGAANNAIRVNDKPSANVDPRRGVVDSIDIANRPTCVGQHRKRDAAFDNF